MRAETFRTDLVARPRRLQFWNEIATDTFGDIAVDSLDSDFSAQLRRIRVGGLSLASVSSTAARISGAHTVRTEGWFLLLNERGASRMTQGHRAVWLRPGELTALRSDEPYSIEFSRPNKTLVMHLPRGARRFDLDPHVAKSHDACEAALFVEFMRRLERLDPRDSPTLPHFERLAADLAALCWPARAGRSRRQPMIAWQQCVQQYVDDRSCDADLSAASIARHFTVSARFVHMVFAKQRTTAARYILERRLCSAAALLVSEPAARISDVALRAGFGDLSHFCRTFRRRFGMSARDYRSRASLA